MSAEKEVTELEQQYRQAIVDKDLDKILSLTADPSLVTGAQGVMSLDHATYRKMMGADSNWELLEFTLERMEANAVTPDVVTTAYTVSENMIVDGKPLSLKAADASTWVRQNGSWVCVLHTESILGDPFGRDKKAATANGAKPAARKKSAAAKRKPQRTVASRRRKVKG